jgi:hypothetical protein
MQDTKTSDGARAWLTAHERRALWVALGLAVGGVVFVVAGSFIQVWLDVGWVPLDELHALQYGPDAAIPVLGDFWGIMLIGSIVLPAILGGAGLGEALKRRRGRKALFPSLEDENLVMGTVTGAAWSSAAKGVVLTVEAGGVSTQLCDTAPLGVWQVSPGASVAVWTVANGEVIVGTGGGIVRGSAGPAEL